MKAILSILLVTLTVGCASSGGFHSRDLLVPSMGAIEASTPQSGRTIGLVVLAPPTTQLISAELFSEPEGMVLHANLRVKWPVTSSKRKVSLVLSDAQGGVIEIREGLGELPPSTGTHHRTRELAFRIPLPDLDGVQSMQLVFGEWTAAEPPG